MRYYKQHYYSIVIKYYLDPETYVIKQYEKTDKEIGSLFCALEKEFEGGYLLLSITQLKDPNRKKYKKERIEN